MTTTVTLTPDYAAWYLTQIGIAPPHAALEGWHIEATWDSGSDVSRYMRYRTGGDYDAPGETWHTLVCEVGGVLGKVYVNVPARFVVAAQVRKPRLLDLFCGAGGSAKGYQRAGFEVTGVDIHPQLRYCGDHFVQGDALAYVAAHGWEYDAIHASPPCQAHSTITPDKSKHIDLIPHTRFWLKAIGKPYIIENVGGARKALHNPVMLCGADFGLKVYRHRWFESNISLAVPYHQPHHDNTPCAGHGVSSKGYISITSGGKSLEVKHNPAAKHRGGLYGVSSKGFVSVCGHFSGADYCRDAMDIDWMTARELSQSIPPAYTEYLGKQLYAYLEGKPMFHQFPLWSETVEAKTEFNVWDVA